MAKRFNSPWKTVKASDTNVVLLTRRPVFGGVPSFTGTLLVGELLTAVATTVTNAGAASWQWLRNGLPISGATAATYTIGSSDAGQLISVKQIQTNAHGTTYATSLAGLVPALPLSQLLFDGAGLVFDGEELLFTTGSAEILFDGSPLEFDGSALTFAAA